MTLQFITPVYFYFLEKLVMTYVACILFLSEATSSGHLRMWGRNDSSSCCGRSSVTHAILTKPRDILFVFLFSIPI